MAMHMIGTWEIVSSSDFDDEYLNMERPFDVKAAYTNEFLDKNVKMPPIHPPKLC